MTRTCDSSVAAVTKRRLSAKYIDRLYRAWCIGALNGKCAGVWRKDGSSHCVSRVSMPELRRYLSSGEKVTITLIPSVGKMRMLCSRRSGFLRSQTLQVLSKEEVAKI